MSGSARRIVVEFLGEDKSLGKTMASTESKSGKLAGALGKVGKMAAIGLAAGAVAGAVGLVKLTQGAIEDEAAQAKLAKTLQNAAGATDKQIAATESWISAQGKALGITDDELRPALQRMAEATGDVTKAQDLVAVAMDVSAGTGRSLKSVTEAMLRAQNGSVDGLSRYGIATKNAAGETMTFEQVTKNMSDTFGGQAATQANTLEGKMARLKLILSEAGETIGSKLIPAVTVMADWFLNKGLPAISAFGSWVQANLLPKLREMGAWIQAGLLPVLRNIGDWISQHVLPVFQRLGNEGPSIFAKIRSAIEAVAPVVLSIAQNVAQKMLPVFEALVDNFRSNLLPTIKLIIDRFMEWWPTISKVVSKAADLGVTILSTVLPPVIKFSGLLISTLVPIILDTIEVIAKIIAKVFEVGAAFVGAIADVARFVGGLREKIGNAIGLVTDLPGKALSALGDLGTTLLNAGRDLIQGLLDGIEEKIGALKAKLSSITDMIPDIKGPIEKDRILLKPAGEALIEGLIAGINKKKTALEKVLSKITDDITKKQDALAALLDKRQSIVDSFKGFASSIFGADINSSEEGAPKGLDAMMAASSGQRAGAEQLNRDVQTLIGKGLSQDLINQLIASGESGMDQISLLATATDDQIRMFNENNAAAQAALNAAGIKAADAVMAGEIAKAKADVALADGIRDKLKDLLDKQDKNTIVQLVLDGKVLHVSLKRLKEHTGKKLGLD
jgi:hypothetical protein